MEEWLDILAKAVGDANKARGDSSKEVKKGKTESLDTAGQTKPPSSESHGEGQNGSSPAHEIESVYSMIAPDVVSLADYVDVEDPTARAGGSLEESVLYEPIRGEEPQDIYDSVPEVINNYISSTKNPQTDQQPHGHPHPPLSDKERPSVPDNGPPLLPDKEKPPPLPDREELPPPLPEKEEGPLLPEKEGLPLPEKEEGPLLPEKEGPPLPEKEEGPPLPEKEEGPPLPEKEEGPPLPEKEA